MVDRIFAVRIFCCRRPTVSAATFKSHSCRVNATELLVTPNCREKDAYRLSKLQLYACKLFLIFSAVFIKFTCDYGQSAWTEIIIIYYEV